MTELFQNDDLEDDYLQIDKLHTGTLCHEPSMAWKMWYLISTGEQWRAPVNCIQKSRPVANPPKEFNVQQNTQPAVLNTEQGQPVNYDAWHQQQQQHYDDMANELYQESTYIPEGVREQLNAGDTTKAPNAPNAPADPSTPSTPITDKPSTPDTIGDPNSGSPDLHAPTQPSSPSINTPSTPSTPSTTDTLTYVNTYYPYQYNHGNYVSAKPCNCTKPNMSVNVLPEIETPVYVPIEHETYELSKFIIPSPESGYISQLSSSLLTPQEFASSTLAEPEFFYNRRNVEEVAPKRKIKTNRRITGHDEL